VKGNQECPVLKHNLEPTENLGSGGRRRGSRKDKETVRDDLGQNQNMGLDGDGKSKSVGDGKQRKLSPLRLSISNNQARRHGHEQETHSHPFVFTLKKTKHVACLDSLYYGIFIVNIHLSLWFMHAIFDLIFVKCVVHVFSIVSHSTCSSVPSFFPLIPFMPSPLPPPPPLYRPTKNVDDIVQIYCHCTRCFCAIFLAELCCSA